MTPKQRIEKYEQTIWRLKRKIEEERCLRILTANLWSATFSKYKSWKANGSKSVKIDNIIKDWQACHDTTGESSPTPPPASK